MRLPQGQEAAESIKRFLEGKDIKEGRRAREDKLVEDMPEFIEKKASVLIPEVPVRSAKGFEEVYLPLNEEGRHGRSKALSQLSQMSRMQDLRRILQA